MLDDNVIDLRFASSSSSSSSSLSPPPHLQPSTSASTSTSSSAHLQSYSHSASSSSYAPSASPRPGPSRPRPRAPAHLMPRVPSASASDTSSHTPLRRATPRAGGSVGGPNAVHATSTDSHEVIAISDSDEDEVEFVGAAAPVPRRAARHRHLTHNAEFRNAIEDIDAALETRQAELAALAANEANLGFFPNAPFDVDDLNHGIGDNGSAFVAPREIFSPPPVNPPRALGIGLGGAVIRQGNREIRYGRSTGGLAERLREIARNRTEENEALERRARQGQLHLPVLRPAPARVSPGRRGVHWGMNQIDVNDDLFNFSDDDTNDEDYQPDINDVLQDGQAPGVGPPAPDVPANGNPFAQFLRRLLPEPPRARRDVMEREIRNLENRQHDIRQNLRYGGPPADQPGNTLEAFLGGLNPGTAFQNDRPALYRHTFGLWQQTQLALMGRLADAAAGPAPRPEDAIRQILGAVVASDIPDAPKGFSRTWDEDELDSTKKTNVIHLDESGNVIVPKPTTKQSPPYLSCAACPEPLRVSGGQRNDDDRVWALRCGHIIDQRCFHGLAEPSPESLRADGNSYLVTTTNLDVEDSRLRPKKKRRAGTSAAAKRERATAAAAARGLEHTYSCPVSGCAREHVSVLIDDKWTQKAGAGAIQMYV